MISTSMASSLLTRDGFSPPPLIGFANHHHHQNNNNHNNSNNHNSNNSHTMMTMNNNKAAATFTKTSAVEVRGSLESLKRIVGHHREVRFMDSSQHPHQEQPIMGTSKLQRSNERFKSMESLVLDMSLIGEDCESSTSPSTTPSERHGGGGDSTYSPSTTNPHTSGNFFKTQTSSEFSTFNANFHDYSAGSEQSSFEFLFDLETEAEEKLKNVLDELDEKLYGFSLVGKKASPILSEPSSTILQRNKRKNRLKENNNLETQTMEKIASHWSTKFPHLIVSSSTCHDQGVIRPDSSIDVVPPHHNQEESNFTTTKQSNLIQSPFGGYVEEVIAEDGDYEETLVVDVPQKKNPLPLIESCLNKSTPNFRANKKKTPRETPQSPQSIQYAERIKVQLNKGFPPIEGQSAVFYEAQWEVFDSIWKTIVPKIMTCFKQNLVEERVERKSKKGSSDNKNVVDDHVVNMDDDYSSNSNDKFIDELEDIDDEDLDQDCRAYTPYSAVSTASYSSSSSRKMLNLGTPSVSDRSEKHQELNNAVLISPFHPKPRRNSYFSLSPNGPVTKATATHEKPALLSRDNSNRNLENRNLEVVQQHSQKQFPVRHNQHFTGGFRPNPTFNQQHNVLSSSNNNPKPLIQKIKVDQSSDRAQTAMPSSFNKLILLENDSKAIPSNPKPPQPPIMTSTFQNSSSSSRPQTQSQFAKKNPSLANIFNSDVNTVRRMEQYDNNNSSGTNSNMNGMMRRNEISSPSIGSTTVTYQTKRKLPKITKPKDLIKR